MSNFKQKQTRSRHTEPRVGRRLLRPLCFMISVLFVLSIFTMALPVRGAAAANNYSTVRVNLKTNNATVLRVTAKGKYNVREAGVTIADQEFTLKSSGSKIEIEIGGNTVYSGSECNIVPVNSNRDAGYLTMNSQNYLGEFRVKVRDNSYIQVINSVPMAYYLYGVLAGEMSDAYPLDALRAQALAAKGFVISKMTGEPNYDIGDTSAEQVYKGYSSSWTKIMQAVDSTISDVLTVNGSYLKTYYSASNGGETQLPQYQWNGISSSITAGYSIALDEPDIGNGSSKFEKLEITYGNVGNISAELYALLTSEASKSASGTVTDIVAIHSVSAHTPKYAGVQRNMTKVSFDISYMVNDTTTKRATLEFSPDKLLDSGVFTNTALSVYWGKETSTGYLIYHVRFGHGVGLSQRGAQQRANNGDDYKKILKFYYPGAEISSINLSVPSGGSSSATAAPSTTKPAQTTQPPTTAPAPSSDPTMPPPVNTVVSTAEGTDKPNSTTAPVTSEPPTDQPLARPTVRAQGKVNGSGVNLRTGPGLNYNVIIRLAKNTKLDIYDMSNSEWYYVGTTDYIGYISSRYVTLNEPQDNKPSSSSEGTYKTGYVNAVDVNFRTGPGTSYNSMGRIAKNTPLYVWGTEGEWSYIQIGVKYGYMFSTYVTVTGDHSTSEIDGTVWASGETKTDVNLRQGPSTDYKIITTLRQGTKLLIYGETENGWLDVATNGQRGYVSGAYVNIESVNPQAPKTNGGSYDAPMGSGYTTAVDVNFRLSPSTSAKIITQLPKRAKLTLYALKDGWYEAEYAGKRGFIYARYVCADSEQESTGSNTSGDKESSGKAESLTLTLGKAMGKLNFRTGASMTAHVQQVFTAGEKFNVIGECGDWYYVLHGNESGYVYKAYTTIVESGSAPILTVGESEQASDGETTARVNLRTGPALTNSIITEMPSRQDVKVLCKTGDWYLVRSGALCGFAYAEYIKP